MNLAETLIKARYKTGMPQRDVGKLIGKSGMAVSNAEKLDGAEVSKDTLKALCAVYNIDYTEMAAMLDAEMSERKESRKLKSLEKKKAIR